ncbi:RNA recognition motif domain-containing protein [Cinnamomum micranthum f. kanehirae]|uniref:RNA recognition motif domain-containing protein n=1 Tax=Cinnamomum micranthum f. kanehirae TaxID=337451 RepID=A0A3S3NYS2_9MAGN|nr:RNA recognition motif domain-containing protein [Cinnamomum micranthum f. kanehirae]
MADGYWRYAEARQPPMAQQAAPPAVKRSRSDYDVPVGHELSGYFSREEERVGHRDARDTESLGASYERYLRGQMSSYGAGDPARPLSGGLSSHHSIDDPRMMGVGGIEPGMGGKGRNIGFGGGRSEMPLPPDASNTLFVEGLPSNCTRREVSRFREVRLVNKESRHGGEPLVLCFVDFTTPAHAAVALDALQGYKFDEHDRDSAILRLQFARFPGPRSGGGPRGKRVLKSAVSYYKGPSVDYSLSGLSFLENAADVGAHIAFGCDIFPYTYCVP